jgi:DNA invertase Pin-like site-specific DNA recombinase
MRSHRTHIAVVFAELERDFIRSRTREALAVRKEQEVVLGGPRSTPDDVVARVVRERLEGRTPTPSRATLIATPCRRRLAGARGHSPLFGHS